jgi:hypothetical protein
MLEIYNAATNELLNGDAIAGLSAGEASATLQLQVYWKKGDPDASIAPNVHLLLRAKNAAGVFAATGTPPQDEYWFRWRVTGQIAVESPTQEPLTLDWRPAGAYTVLELGDLHAGCARLVELQAQPPSSAGPDGTTYEWQLLTRYNEFAIPAPPHTTELHRGVLTGVGDRSRSGLVHGGEVTASAVPDAEVHVAASLALVRGTLDGLIAQTLTLDQDDGAAIPEALEAGESYLAVLTRAAGAVTATKGLRAAAPVEPARPAGEPYLKTVEVHFQAGGTSVIDQADITGTTLYDRLRVVAGAALELLLHHGRALGGGTYRFRTARTSVPLDDDTETWLWQTAAGEPEVTATADPAADTDLPLARAVTAGGVITELEDLRPVAGRVEHLRLQGTAPADPLGGATAIASLLVEATELQVDVAAYRLAAAGGGSAGQYTLSYSVNGATAYPGAATDDQRAQIPFDAAGADLQHRSGIPETLVLHRGDVVELMVDEVPTGAAAVLAELVLVCRVP